MAIKQSSKKIEFEYESPDGTVYNIIFVEALDQKSVEISKANDTDLTQKFDFTMLCDLVDNLRKETKINSLNQKQHNLPAPKVLDHRDQAEEIQEAVDKTIQNYNEANKPIQSFTAAEETGVLSDDADLKE